MSKVLRCTLLLVSRIMPKKLAALGMSPKGKSISKKDFKMMKQIFIDYDKDHSGTVTYREFINSFGPKQKCVMKSAAGMFQELDADGSGEMSFPELLKAFYPACTEADILKTIDKYILALVSCVSS